MESAFSWLGDIVNWFGKLIPKILIVKKTHGGVAFVRGHTSVKLNPGWHCYWPFWTEVLIFPTARQTVNLPSQCLMTKDGKSVVVSGIVVYKIYDIELALAENWDIDDTIKDLALASIKEIIVGKSVNDVCTENALLDIQLTTKLSKELYNFGVSVVAVRITDFSTCLVIKNMGQESSLIPTAESKIDE